MGEVAPRAAFAHEIELGSAFDLAEGVDDFAGDLNGSFGIDGAERWAAVTIDVAITVGVRTEFPAEDGVPVEQIAQVEHRVLESARVLRIDLDVLHPGC